MLPDLRFALRTLLKSSGFSLVAVLTVAIGIASVTLVYSVANAVIFRPLPYKDESSLVWIWSTRPDRDRAFFSIPDFLDLKSTNQTTVGLAAIMPMGITVTGDGEPERVNGWRVTANLFSLLGTEPHLGRLPQAADDAPSAPPVAVLGYSYWQRRYGGDSTLVGRTINLNGVSRTVVGILAKDFVIPNWDSDVIFTQSLEGDPRRTERGTQFLRAIARLKPGVTPGEAQTEFATLNQRLMDQFPGTNAIVTAPRFVPLHEEAVGGYGHSLLILLGASGALLVIMCTNLAGLLAARALSRRREAALCSALGASPARLVRTSLAEGLLLSSVGGIVGVLACAWGIDALVALAPADLPRATLIAIDPRVLLVAASASLLTGLAVGLAPALRMARTQPQDALKSGSLAMTERSAARAILVGAQIGLCTTLLICTGLLVRSLSELLRAAPGFVSAPVLTAQLALPGPAYRTVPLVSAFLDESTRRLGELPGVKSVSLTSVLPLSGINTRSEFTRADRPPARPTDTLSAANRFVGEIFFATVGIPILAGRDFRPTDDASGQAVVIVDQALAQRHWPDGDPVGQSILIRDGTSPEPRALTIIGVVGATKHFSLEEASTPAIYLPVRQMVPGNLSFFIGRINFVVRTDGDPLALRDSARRALRAVEPNATVAVRSYDDAIAWARAPRIFSLRLLGFFSAAAVLLAVLGLYAITAQAVASRTREIGIRMALGADRLRIARQVLGSSSRLVVAGIAIGIGLAAALAPMLTRLLYQVRPFDLTTYAVVAGLLACTALLATWLPARRAAKVDPMVALRSE